MYTVTLAIKSALMHGWPMLQVLRKEQAMSEDSAFLKEQMEALLKVSCTQQLCISILSAVIKAKAQIIPCKGGALSTA